MRALPPYTSRLHRHPSVLQLPSPPRWPRTVRRSVDAIFYKARTGKLWPNVLKETGATIQASKHFNAWTSEDTWSRVNAALAGVEQVPLPELQLLPSMLIEGRRRPERDAERRRTIPNGMPIAVMQSSTPANK